MRTVIALMAIAATVGLVALASKHDGPPPSGVPLGWEPPVGSVLVSVPPSATLNFPVRGASWKANGQDVVLWWDPTDPQTFLAMQSLGKLPNGNENVAMLARGTTANSLVLFNLMKSLVT